MARFTIQRYCAKNDTNGNPRRVFVVRRLELPENMTGSGWGTVVLTVDEGYGESVRTVSDQIRRTWSLPHIYDLGDVDVAPGVYRRMINYLK